MRAAPPIASRRPRPTPKGQHSARSKPLDGLRAIAVLAVLAYHAHYPWAQGGFLGVDVFFVLSGYLITKGLLTLRPTGPRGHLLAYRCFLRRRCARLMPALLVMLTALWVLTATTGPADRERLTACTAAAAGYAMNLPIGQQLRCSAPWHITWSLAAEEQFYLLWPIALAGMCTWAARSGLPIRRNAGYGTLLLLAIAVAWQCWLREGDPNTARVFFAPDGRSLILLLGCALALGADPVLRLVSRVGPRYEAAGGYLVLGATLVLGRAGSGHLPLAAVLLAGASTAAVVAASVQDGEELALRALAQPALVWTGRISYSLYLWHEVAYRIADMSFDRGSAGCEALRWVLTFSLAILSYRYVETRAQRCSSPGRLLRKRPQQRHISDEDRHR